MNFGCRLLASGLFTLAMSVEASTAKNWTFQVFLDGKEIGHHEYNLTEEGGSLKVISKASYDVKFLFFNAYRYRHRAEELWRDGCLVDAMATTDDNGDKYDLRVQASGEQVNILLNDELSVEKALACPRSYAYWLPELNTSQQLINTQTGEVVDAVFTTLLPQSLPWSQEQVVTPIELRSDDGVIRLWYDQQGQWVGLQSTLDNGRTLEYRLAAKTNPTVLVEEML